MALHLTLTTPAVIKKNLIELEDVVPHILHWNIIAMFRQDGSPCYYCDYHTNAEDDYQHHVVLKHLGKLAYPSKAYLERLGMKPKGKDVWHMKMTTWQSLLAARLGSTNLLIDSTKVKSRK